ARRLLVRARTVDGRDAPVVPVRPGVGREQQRRTEGHELHGARDRGDDAERGGSRADERDADRVQRERHGNTGEEGNGPRAVAGGMAAVPWHERGSVRPRARARDEDRGADAGARGRRATAQGAAAAGRAWSPAWSRAGSAPGV